MGYFMNKIVKASTLLLIMVVSGLSAAQQSFEERLAQAAAQVTQRTKQAAEEMAARIQQSSAQTVNQIKAALAEEPLNPVPASGRFLEAIKRAEDAGPSKISRKLIEIVPWNPNLLWKDDKKSYVLMVSWIADVVVDPYYRPFIGQAMVTPQLAGLYVWATVVPELKDFVRRSFLPGEDQQAVHNRLYQYLGLPLSQNPENRFFVEFWARPQDIFRPCIDAEVVDSACIPDPNPKELPAGYPPISSFVSSDAPHQKWFESQKASRYQGSWAMPWTRLGYTYDWAPSAPTYQGASEFVIKQGATIFIQSITPTAQYATTPLPLHYRDRQQALKP